MGNCTYVSHWHVNSGSWSSANGYALLGSQGIYNYHAVEIKFTTPALECNSKSITFKLGMAQGTATNLSLRYAITTSTDNENKYINTYEAVSDENQIASGTTSISGLSTTVTYPEITINTDQISKNGGTYYLFLWPAVDGNVGGYGVIQPPAYVDHSITVTSNTHNAVYGGTSDVHTKCSRCGTTLSTSHTYDVDSGVQYNAANCTTPQRNHLRCACGYNPRSAAYLVSVGSALGHAEVYGGTSDVHTKCSRCGTILSSSHSYTVDSGVQYSAATCTAARQNYKRCACGYNPKSSSYLVSVGDKNPNNHTGSETKGGKKDAHSKYSCCGVTIKNGSYHSYTESVSVAATCTEKGTTKYTCSCGYSYTSQNIPALGHDYVGEVTIEPTYITDGVMTYTCSRCKDSYTEVIPKKEGGLVYIYDGTTFIPYQAYIYNGSDWDLYIPYIYNGSDWDICC